MRRNLNLDDYSIIPRPEAGDEVYRIIESWECDGHYNRCRRYGIVKEVIWASQYRDVKWEDFYQLIRIDNMKSHQVTLEFATKAERDLWKSWYKRSGCKGFSCWMGQSGEKWRHEMEKKINQWPNRSEKFVI